MESLLRRISELHSATGVVKNLIQLMQYDEFSMNEVTQCLERDPALSARVLASVNSASSGVSHKVSNIQQAVALLGRRKLRTVVLAFSVVERLTQGLDSYFYFDYWKRSLTTSIVADLLARKVKIDSNDAFTAGLLVDIGVLVLTQFEAEKYIPIYEEHDHGKELVAAERAALGFDHAELSARVLEVWNLPPELSMAVACHHDKDEAELDDFSRVLHAANLLPAAIWIADSATFQEAFEAFQSFFGFTVDSFIELAIDVNRLVEEEAVAFGIEGVRSVDCDELREEAERLLAADTVCED